MSVLSHENRAAVPPRGLCFHISHLVKVEVSVFTLLYGLTSGNKAAFGWGPQLVMEKRLYWGNNLIRLFLYRSTNLQSVMTCSRVAAAPGDPFVPLLILKVGFHNAPHRFLSHDLQQYRL